MKSSALRCLVIDYDTFILELVLFPTQEEEKQYRGQEKTGHCGLPVLSTSISSQLLFNPSLRWSPRFIKPGHKFMRGELVSLHFITEGS